MPKSNISNISSDFLEISKLNEYDIIEFGLKTNIVLSNEQLRYDIHYHTPEIGFTRDIPLLETQVENDLSNCLFEINRKRKSIRTNNNRLSFEDLSLLLQRSYFLTNKNPNKFNIPSSGALYPIELYIINIQTIGLNEGIYYYNPYTASLQEIRNLSKEETLNTINKGFMANKRDDIDINNASAIILFGAILNRVVVKYQDRGIRFALIDVGAILHNIYLNATTLNINCCANGGYVDDYVANLIDLKSNQQTVLLTAILGK